MTVEMTAHTPVVGAPPAVRLELADLVDQAGLRGRGGARFPTAVKLRAAGQNQARLIVNACDGEVGTAKDEYVISSHLREVHRVAQQISAEVVWAAHRGSATEQVLRQAGLEVLPAPERYVSSEESALISLLEGGLARPLMRTKPIIDGARDSRGRTVRPTLVLNAETLWRIAQLQENGIEWFRSRGTAQEPGPRLVTITGAVQHPGFYHAAAGDSLASLLGSAGATDFQAVGISGLSGGWLTRKEAMRATWSDAALAEFGLTTGTGALHVLPVGVCPVREMSDLTAYGAGESAGQCGPCMFGLPAVAEQVSLLADRRLPADQLPGLHHRLGLLPGRGACRFPDGVSRFVASGLRAFAGEVEAHLRGECLGGRHG